MEITNNQTPMPDGRQAITKNAARSFLLALALLAPSVALADSANVSFQAVGSSTAAVILDTGDNSINAISGTIHSDKKIGSVLDGSSFVPIWIQMPTVSPDGLSVSFAGIVPGGFTGKKEIMSIVFDSKSSGQARLSALDLQVLHGADSPTQVQAVSKPSLVKIGQGSPSVISQDAIPPEPFLPVIGKDPEAFNGETFVAFSTTDKQSGIASYSYASTWLSSPNPSDWKETSSPQVLSSGDGGKLIWIKAIDRAGNERIERAAGPWHYLLILILAIIIISLITICARYPAHKRSLHSSSPLP